MITTTCANCAAQVSMYPCRFKKASTHFCSKSCHRAFKNKQDNPSKHRDLKGANNPMFGKHPPAWNKGLTGEQSHNWRGGVHTRKDGYVRISINGERQLLHRYLKRHEITDRKQVVHHLDENPSNNSPENLVVLSSQAEHARLHLSSRSAENRE